MVQVNTAALESGSLDDSHEAAPRPFATRSRSSPPRAEVRTLIITALMEG